MKLSHHIRRAHVAAIHVAHHPKFHAASHTAEIGYLLASLTERSVLHTGTVLAVLLFVLIQLAGVATE